MCNFAANAAKILRTGKGRPDLSSLLCAREVADLAVERWMLPRSQRRPEYRSWTSDDLLELLGNQRRVRQIRRAYDAGARTDMPTGR